MTQVAQTEMGGSSSGERYIDTDKMASCISNIETAITSAETAIESYSAKAPSLGASTSLGAVESNLSAIKNSYTNDLLPLLSKLRQDVEDVKEEYISRSTQIENAGSGE